MPKPTPNPPESSPYTPSSLYVIAPGIDTETLLASACESLASASVMACDFAVFVSGPQRQMLLGIQRLIMLADLAVNRALDNIDSKASRGGSLAAFPRGTWE